MNAVLSAVLAWMAECCCEGCWRRVLDAALPTMVAWGPLGAFLLALVDAAGVPNPAGVDYLILLLAWKEPSTAYPAALLALAGSLGGSYFLYRLARKGGERFLDRYTLTGRGARFRGWFHRYGLITIFVPALVPMIPLPMKVFVLCAGAFGVRPLTFLAVMAAGRLPRCFGLAWLGRQFGEDASGWLKSHASDFAWGALILIALLVLLVRLSGRVRAPAPR
jgi:undecaprenyl-diphosphatase